MDKLTEELYELFILTPANFRKTLRSRLLLPSFLLVTLTLVAIFLGGVHPLDGVLGLVAVGGVWWYLGFIYKSNRIIRKKRVPKQEKEFVLEESDDGRQEMDMSQFFYSTHEQTDVYSFDDMFEEIINGQDSKKISSALTSRREHKLKGITIT